MMLPRLLLGGLIMVLGIACIAATDRVWIVVAWLNARRGRAVTRTERWNARVSFAGVILIGCGILFIIAGAARL